MKRMLGWVVLLTLALTLGSCRRAIEKSAAKIRLEAVERITPRGLTGAEAVVRIQNGSAHKLTLSDAEFTLCYKNSKAFTLKLLEAVTIEKRTTASLTTRWRMQLADPLALMLAGRDFQAGDDSKLFVSYAIEGRGGPANRNLAREMVPLSEFLRIFGVTMDDLKSYF